MQHQPHTQQRPPPQPQGYGAPPPAHYQQQQQAKPTQDAPAGGDWKDSLALPPKDERYRRGDFC